MNLRAFQAGLGNFRSSLLPIPEEVAAQMDPRTIEMLRRQAMLQMGLGMLAAGEKGAGLGAGASFGLGQAQDVMGRGLGQAWAAQRARREDQRFDLQERRTDELMKRQERLDTRAQTWRDEDRAYQAARDAEDQAFRELQMQNMAADNARASAQLGLAERADRRSAAAQHATASNAKQEALLRQYQLKLGEFLAKYPNDPRAGEMKKRWEALTLRAWDKGGLDLSGALGAAPPLDDLYR